jgi:hypothetical protein
MPDEHNADPQKPETKSTSPISPPKAGNSNPANHNTEQQREKWWQQPINWPHIFQTVGILVGIAVAWIYWNQLQEMGNQTRLLDEQANRSAIENIGNAAATNRQLGILQQQSKTAQDNVAAIRQQMRVDERAWMNVGVGLAPLIDGQPIFMPVRLVDSGKTPAIKAKGTVIVNLLNTGTDPDFSFKAGHPRYNFDVGFIAPNQPQTIQWAVLPEYLPVSDVLVQTLTTPAIRQGMSDGSMYIVVHGKITYTDIFGGRHWMTFCALAENAKPSGTGSEKCASYNKLGDE